MEFIGNNHRTKCIQRMNLLNAACRKCSEEGKVRISSWGVSNYMVSCGGFGACFQGDFF